jgi:hypothetical protein
LASTRRRSAFHALIGLVGLGLVAVLMVYAAGERSSNGPIADLIHRAAEQTAASGPTSFAFDGRELSGGRPIVPPVSLTGTVDAARNAMEVDYDTLTIRSIASVIYIKYAPLNLPPGAEWVRTRPTPMPASSRSSYEDVTTLPATIDPTAYLQVLKHVDAAPARVDRQTIAGVPTTHWTATLNIQQLLTNHSPDLTSLMTSYYNNIAELTDLTKVPVEVWIDDANKIRRFVLVQTVREDRDIIATKTYTFTKFGTAPVAVPPKSRTIPARNQDMQTLLVRPTAGKHH